MAEYAPKYFTIDEVVTKLGSAAPEIYDDDNDGELDQDAILLDIEAADGEVDSWALSIYDVADIPTADRLMRHAAMTFFVAFAYERHPEYVRSGKAGKLYERAEAIMQRLRKAERRLPDAAVPPANVGGEVSATTDDPDFPCPAPQFFADMGDF